MGRPKSPQLKKQDAYERDYRPLLENPHAFRKNWRKKKSREHRRDRAALRSVMSTVDGDELTATAVAHIRARQAAVKSHMMTLRERLAFNGVRRAMAGMFGPQLDTAAEDRR